MKIIMIRHLRTEGNLKRRYIGATDEDICENISILYPQCDIVVSSPMKRCIQTARLIYPGKKIHICDGLRECDFGDFENKSYEDLKEDAYYKKWLDSMGKLPFPGGESHEAFKKRCVDSFFKAVNLYGCETLAFVVHGGTIMAVLEKIMGGNFYDYMTENGQYREFILRYNTKRRG